MSSNAPELRPDAATPCAWGEAEAAFYARSIVRSGYARAVLPLLPRSLPDLLDIGAGNGVLSRRMLAPGARWHAVEPQPEMQRRLLARRAALAAAQAHVIERLRLPPGDERRPQVLAQVAASARPGDRGVRLGCAKRSAVLLWRRD